MIKWESKIGHSIEIEILGYQFPKAEDEWDSNWLNIKINAKNENYYWTKIAACSLTWDILSLQNWLVEVIIGESETESFIFAEYDLELKYIAESTNKHVFAVVLRAGLSFSIDDRDVVFVSVSDKEFEDSINYLKKVSSLFPPKGELGRNNLKRIQETYRTKARNRSLDSI